MNHPTDEELSDFLYQDLPTARRAEVEAHLLACEQCRHQVQLWRQVRGALRDWKVADRPPTTAARPRRQVTVVLRGAVAASVLLATGFFVARWSAPRPATFASSRVDPQIIEQLRAELKRDLTVQLGALHREYRANVEQQIRLIEAARLADYSGLRKDVETVALRTQEEFARLTSPASPVDHDQ